ncbi:MAG: hypothetical protein M1822_008848 [Bathelium mastoideum]|nr:MAG: hypothetical protein M1822_008848 [Bathelium mastoideum]
MSQSSSASRRRKRGSAKTSDITATRTTTSLSSGPYSLSFQQRLIDGGIYPLGYQYPSGKVPAKPSNWDTINQRLLVPRSSLSPSQFSEEAHERFVQADTDAAKEDQIKKSVMPIITGRDRDGKTVSGDVPFGNLEPLIPPICEEETLKLAKPDYYYGARPEQLNRQIRNDLSSIIIPSKQHDLPMVPNFFIEAKGPDGSLAVANRQACYDGTCGARAMQTLQSYNLEQMVFDNNAYTLSTTYHGGTLKMFAHHPYQSDATRTQPEYCMHQIKGWAMTSDPETFRKGATAFRNLKDWAGEQRDAFITQANARVSVAGDASTQGSSSLSFTSTIESEDPYEDSETSADELSMDIRSMSKRPRAPRRRSRSNRKGRTTVATSLQSAGSVTWKWENGVYRCYQADQVVKYQSELPAHVWVYYASGWPKRRGKTWMYYDSNTKEYHFR